MDINGLLGKTVHIVRGRPTGDKSVVTHSRVTDYANPRNGARLLGVNWKVVETDRSKGLVTLRSCAHWSVKSVCRVEVFTRYLREGWLEVE